MKQKALAELVAAARRVVEAGTEAGDDIAALRELIGPAEEQLQFLSQLGAASVEAAQAIERALMLASQIRPVPPTEHTIESKVHLEKGGAAKLRGGFLDVWSAIRALTPEQRAKAAQEALEPYRQRPGASQVGQAERHRVDVHRSIVALAVESLETVRVYGLSAQPNASLQVNAEEPMAWVSPEASAEALQRLRDACTAELERRHGRGA